MTAAAPEAPATDQPYEPKPYQAEADENVTCPNCGKMDDDDAKFCDQCGFKLEGAQGVVVGPTVADPEDAATTAAAPPVPPTSAPSPAPVAPAAPAAPVAEPGVMQWAGCLMDLDTPSSDGRMFSSAGLTVRTLPLPLSYQCEGEHGGDMAGTTVIVGRILTAEVQGNKLMGTGDFFDPMTSDAPTAAIEQVAGGIGCVSVDAAVQVVTYLAPGPDGTLIPIDPMQFMGDPDTVVMVAEQSEIAGATIVSFPAFADARITLVTDTSAPNFDAVTADAASPQPPVLTPDSVTFSDGTVLHVGDSVNVVDAADGPTTGTIATIDPESNSVTVTMDDDSSVTVDAAALDVVTSLENDDSEAGSGAPTTGLTAAIAFPGLQEEHVYPAEWFEPVALDGPTRLTITDDGRVYGHAAEFGTCHIGFANECVAPPSSPSGYGYFHVGEVKTSAGLLAVGKLTVGGGHADIKAGWRAAMEHYDDAGAAVAVVRAHEDEFGIQVTGALLPNATGTQIAALRRNHLSGDWRPIGGHREMVAAHSINTGGFPLTPRAALAADGSPLALVAAGVIHAPAGEGEPAAVGMTLPSGTKLTADDVAVLASAFADVTEQRHRAQFEREQRAGEARALRSKLLRNRLLKAV